MKKQIALGVAVGFLIPIVFIVLLYLVFYAFEKDMTEQVLSSGLLFGIGLNALMMRFSFKKNKDYLARGVMIASFICFIVLVVKFVM